MSHITFKFLVENNFQYKGLANIPIIDICIRCKREFTYVRLKKFLRNRISIPKTEWCQCQKCFLIHRTRDNPQWKANNSKSQLIAQNKPEQKKKNAIAVSKSWNSDRKQKASIFLKNRWKTDDVFVKKAKANLKHDMGHTYRSFGTGGLKGYYNDLYYDSALELSFILWCEEHKIPIIRYNLEPIPYILDNKQRLYFPDFIINQNTIVEIKGRGLYFAKNKKSNLAKTKKAKKQLGEKFWIIFDNEIEVKTNYNKARKLHHEIKEKNSD